MANALANMTKEEKDEMVRQKMEDMKRKSEEILKRHLEIEADKRNADMHSKAVIERKKSNPTPVHVEAPKEKRLPNRSSRHQLVVRTDSKEVEEKKKQRLSDGDAPPPDPNFNFLSDPLRQNEEILEQTETNRKDPSFRHKNNFGGEDFQNVKSTIKQQRNYAKEHPTTPPKNKMEMALKMTGKERKDYESWRKEREKIDQERIARQKTSEGTFKREWDNNKLSQLNDNPTKKPDEYYKSPQWNNEVDRSASENSGRFRGREPQVEGNRFDSSPNDFSSGTGNNRMNQRDRRFNQDGGRNFEQNPTKPPLYPGWEPKKSFGHSRSDGFKKWESRDGNRRSDSHSWRSAPDESDSFRGRNIPNRGERGRRNSPTNHAQTWGQSQSNNDRNAASNKQDVGAESWDVGLSENERDNLEPGDLDTWRLVKQDELWEVNPIQNQSDDLDTVHLENSEIDLEGMKNIVIECRGQNRKVQVEPENTPVKEKPDTENAEILEDENDEDGWEDVTEEEVDDNEADAEKMSYESLRSTLNEEVRQIEKMLNKTNI